MSKKKKKAKNINREETLFYRDVVEIHPEWTEEEHDRAIAEAHEESLKMTEWPPM